VTKRRSGLTGEFHFTAVAALEAVATVPTITMVISAAVF